MGWCEATAPRRSRVVAVDESRGRRPCGGPPGTMRGALLSTLLLATLAVPGAAEARGVQDHDIRAGDGRPAAGGATEAAGGGLETGQPPEPAGDTLTLEAALQVALGKNPDLSAARAKHSGEMAGRWADWGAFLPEVTGTADFDRTNATRLTFQGEDGTSKEAAEPISFTRKSATRQLSLEWTLLEGGRRILDLKEGAARADAARHRVSMSEREVVARVKRTYFEALKQQNLLDVARRQLEARREELEVTRERVEAGAGTRTDLLGARGEVGQAELALLDARDRASRERRVLREQMGVRRSGDLSFQGLQDVQTLPDVGKLSFEALVEQALSSDPEIRALDADARAASAASSSAWTRYLPEIRASYARTRSESGGPQSPFFDFDPDDSFGSLGLTISWNLFEGFDRRERTGRAGAELREARAERRKRTLEIERQIGNLLSELRRRSERLEVLERNFELARERLELARESYEAGIRTFDELQVFIDEDREAEEALSTERYQYLKLWADLEELVGPLSELTSPGDVRQGPARRSARTSPGDLR